MRDSQVNCRAPFPQKNHRYTAAWYRGWLYFGQRVLWKPRKAQKRPLSPLRGKSPNKRPEGNQSGEMRRGQ
eukprot:5259842-Lingulodinium_polyedra.AAC.1